MTLTDPEPGFQGHNIFEVEYLKNCILGTKLLKNTNRKPYTIYQMKGSMKEPNIFYIYETEKITQPVTRQNISSCSVLSPEIVMHDAFNVIL